MNIAIISDTHDQISLIEIFLTWAQQSKIDVIFHCGDISTLDTLRYIYEHWKKELYICLGNADAFASGSDIWKYELPDFVHVFEEEGRFELDHLSFHINHYPDKAKQAALTKSYDFVFYGHTHKPWMEKVNGAYVLNPGTLGGIRYPATFCLLNTKTKLFELKRLTDIHV